MSDTFTVSWEVEDGYVGGARPQSFDVDASEVEGLDEDQLRLLFWDLIQEDFNQNISPISPDEDRFVEWARNLSDD